MTQVVGPVVMPDGEVPAHGRITFERLATGVDGGSIITRGPVEAVLDGSGNFEVELQSEAAGTPYRVTVSYWSAARNRLVTEVLANAVPSGQAGPVTHDAIAAVSIPAQAGDTVTIRQGDSLNLALQHLDGNDRPLATTGLTFTSWIERAGDAAVPLTVTVINAGAGTLEFTLSAGVIAALPTGTYAWVVRMTNGVRVRNMTGRINILGVTA